MGWSGWFDLGGPPGGFAGGPATISRNGSVDNVYVRGNDDALWQKAWFDGRWHDWGRHGDGGVLASEPAVGSMGPDHETVYVRGTNGTVWQKFWTSTAGWSGWFDLGGPPGGFAGGPATISRNGGVDNVYVRGNDDALWQKAWFDGRWHDWGRHGDGGVLASEPAVGSMGPDHETVYVRGTNGTVWQKFWTSTAGWSGWFDLGGPPGGFAGGPATISRNGGVDNVYVRGNDDALWQKAWFDGRWHDWGRHGDGGVLASEPAVGSMGPDHETVYVRGTNGTVWQKFWTAENVAEVSFAVDECVYGWTARYHQAGTRITVRVQLNPDEGISAATMDSLRTTWRNGIIGAWSDRFACRAGGAQQAFTFDVQWVAAGAHHQVRVRPGPDRSNMGTWDTSDTAAVAAHEFGHMVGHPDEYADTACPARSPVGTGSVMDDNTETVARLYQRFATFHGAGHVPVAVAGEPPSPEPEAHVELRRLDGLDPEPRTRALRRLRAMAEPGGDDAGAEELEVTFEVSGGAPGERYSYRVGVRGDGTAERRVADEIRPASGREDSQQVEQRLVRQVFGAAAEAGLLDDDAPQVSRRRSTELLPDSMVAIVTVRAGDAVRRSVTAADEPGAGTGATGRMAEVPVDAAVLLPAEAASALGPVLAALREVEEQL